MFVFSQQWAGVQLFAFGATWCCDPRSKQVADSSVRWRGCQWPSVSIWFRSSRERVSLLRATISTYIICACPGGTGPPCSVFLCLHTEQVSDSVSNEERVNTLLFEAIKMTFTFLSRHVPFKICDGWVREIARRVLYYSVIVIIVGYIVICDLKKQCHILESSHFLDEHHGAPGTYFEFIGNYVQLF